ncbi:VOC family protein [Pseudochrobactrum sp. MP213Fo]|uniref:VOC family protein n=1 Tax=Pseudochrobactrum sp. MP213Fo TaxID=3022250 RepID=UPI003BA3B2E2
MTGTIKSARKIDHLVLPVAGLDASQERLHTLGFTTAPQGNHPFGTSNICFYLSDGSFLEMLGIGDRELYEQSAGRGNVFTARDLAWRFRNAALNQGEGISALVLASDDALADDAYYRANGISGGDVLNFSRPFKTPEGAEDEASFRLAFAADLRAPDVFFFACQRVHVPEVDRTSLQNHPNSVLSIKEIVFSEENPSDFQYLLQTVLEQRDVNAHSFGLDICAGNTNISVLTPTGLQAFYGVEVPEYQPRERGLRLEAVSFKVRSLELLTEYLTTKNVPYTIRNQRVVVQPQRGQGGIFAFEE